MLHPTSLDQPNDAVVRGHPPGADTEFEEGRELSLRQKSFCEFYVRHGNAAQAARDCGYAPGNAADTGCRLLKNPRVVTEIAELQLAEKSAEDRVRDELLNKLERIYEAALDKGNLAAAVRAVEAQARLRAQETGRKAALQAAEEAKAAAHTAVPETPDTPDGPDTSDEPVELDEPVNPHPLPTHAIKEIMLERALKEYFGGGERPLVRADRHGTPIQDYRGYLAAELLDDDTEERTRALAAIRDNQKPASPSEGKTENHRHL